MPTANGTAAPGAIRLVVDDEGRRVLVFGSERIVLPGVHPGGPLPEPRVAEDQAGRRVLLLGTETIPLPDGTGESPAAGGDAPTALPGHPARVEVDAEGDTFAVFEGERVLIAPLPLTPEQAANARVLVDDGGRRILVAGPERLVLPPPASAGAPALVLTDEGGHTVLLHAGERTPLPGVSLTRAEASSARVFTDDMGRRVLVAGTRRILVPSADAPAAPAPPPVPVAPPAAVPAEPPPSPPPAPRRVDPADLHLRSEELQEIIGFVPHWLVRWGTVLVFATVGMLAAVGWFVSYPDVVAGTAVLTTPVPPVRLAPRVSGELEHRFVDDGEPVRPGDPLVVLRSTSDWRDVFGLSGRLDRFEREWTDPAAAPDTEFGPLPGLGDLGAPYSAFLQALSDYRSGGGGGYDLRRVAELERQIGDQQAMRENARAKQRVLAEELELARRARDRARAMAAQRLISDADVERAEAEYLQRSSALRDGESAIAAASVQISALRAQVLEAGKQLDEGGRSRGLALRTALASLRGAVARWDQDHVLRATGAGRASLFRVLAPRQFVDPGVPLLAIVPDSGEAVARVLLATAGAGKVEEGQRVLLRLESFPSREFGAIVGRVAHVSQLPVEQRDGDEARYRVDVALPRELVTTYGRRLPFRQEMRADAEIVTRERRLLQRVFDQVRGSVDPGGG